MVIPPATLRRGVSMRLRLELSREQILAFRRRVGGLGERVPLDPESLRSVAWAGLQDSMPRAAVLSLHARLEGVEPSSWEHPELAQLWGPRYATYVVPRQDFAVFSLGRMPDTAKGRERAERMARLLHEHVGSGRMRDRDAGEALGFNPNAFKYGTTTGTVAIRWDGARAPLVWRVDPGDVDPAEAQRELARRYLHVFGPTTSDGFARWAGVSRRAGAATFAALEASLLPVRTPLGDEWLLDSDEEAARAGAGPDARARLLPSGDAYFLLDGAERTLLVPDPSLRERLWTSRVWPGALLIEGEVRGTWRRANRTVKVETWGELSAAEREAVEAEAASLPLPGLDGRIVVEWGA
jgi:hypothetical protein